MKISIENLVENEKGFQIIFLQALSIESASYMENNNLMK